MSLIRKLGKAAIAKSVKERSAGRGIVGLGLGMLAARIATRSVPGALLVGGAYLAKKLYDKKKAEPAE